MTHFVSRHHPGRTPAAALLVRAQGAPVGLAFAAVMIVTTAAALQGLPVLRAVLLFVPLVYVGAVAWSLYDLNRTPAEVLIGEGMGAVRSVWDVASAPHGPAQYVPIFHPRKGDGALLVGFGDAVVAFRPDDWAEFDDLRDALTASADAADAARFALLAS
ncbi:MAG TPA: hypothetical protein VK610_00810 [Rhodothermales bacterium]|nr:hypothetical protein [Rhodothermales bacterium]